MFLRTVFRRWAFVPALLLAGCGGGDAVDGNSTAPAAPVAGKQAPAGQNWTEVVVRTPENGYRMGNPDAPIKLVEFGSRTCHVCKDFDEAAFGPLTTQYVASGKVSYEFRDFLRNGADIAAALLGQCGGPAPFFPILNQMYAQQPQTLARAEALDQSFYERLEALPPAGQATAFAEAVGYLDFIKQRGVPEAKARQCLADTNLAGALSRMNEDASREHNIPGTPAFLLNGRMLPNTVNWTQVEQALKAAGA